MRAVGCAISYSNPAAQCTKWLDIASHKATYCPAPCSPEGESHLQLSALLECLTPLVFLRVKKCCWAYLQPTQCLISVKKKYTSTLSCCGEALEDGRVNSSLSSLCCSCPWKEGTLIFSISYTGREKHNSLQRNSAKSTLWSKKYLVEQITHIAFPGFALPNPSVTTAHLQHQQDLFCPCLPKRQHHLSYSVFTVPLWWENTTWKCEPFWEYEAMNECTRNKAGKGWWRQI